MDGSKDIQKIAAVDLSPRTFGTVKPRSNKKFQGGYFKKRMREIRRAEPKGIF